MTQIETYPVKCPTCGGKGWHYDHETGIFSFGIGYLIQTLVGESQRDDPRFWCERCQGTGFVYLKRKISTTP